MNIRSCIEHTKNTALQGLLDTVKILIKEKVPEKIILDSVLELYINVVASVNKHKISEIFKSMDDAEVYLKAYCDDFREVNGMLNEEEGDE